ncbi:protein-disulfide reductase DsbD family protein [Parahaliea mediterranea]|uniref:Protein-disulfide reductase DsbD n=1 Tax=Parahaliea mediterranea TaxID=651086 RepID=A0A939DIX6_9GAMM|nr:protein-disulfide reductase DsbD [Parahaliea mediterranea]MBN7799103.1 protein-disulfide reductase DsbD [Parahaliea mediterranea]
MRLILAGLLLLASCLSHAQFGGSTANQPFAASSGPEFLPVEEAYQIEVVPQEGGLRLYWQIAPSYYLYQHQFKFSLRDAAGAVAATPDFPPAIERSDEFFGDTRVYYDSADIDLATARQQGPATLTVTSQGCADAGLCYPPRTQTFAVDFDSGTATEVDATATPVADAAPRGTETASLATAAGMLLLAFAGGALLNLMPCVFPVLSLKVLSFADSSPHARHRQSWIYAAGVVSSFVLVAALLIGLQQGGRAIGWGFQLQSPGFVIALAYLFLAMGLSLSGVVQLGSSLMNTGAGLAERKGDSGSFFTGVLAVVVASPCTAPMMGTALGFAITQPAAVSLLVFAALGAGMAAPLVLLSYSGLARRLMPRPGPWMESLKQFLAFPLYASAIWLLWVAGRQAGVDTMGAALLGGLFLALALWLWRGTPWRRALALGCIAVAAGLALWRPALNGGGAERDPAHGIAWSQQTLAELRASGRPVFVDVTADWCITCIANERAVLHTEEVRAAFDAQGVAYLVADWTNYDPAIADFLRQHGRNGIPLYVLYPADPGREPLILPQLLRKQVVLQALAEASSKKPEVIGSL